MILQTIDDTTAQVLDRQGLILFEGPWQEAEAFYQEERQRQDAARLITLAAKGTDRTPQEDEELFRLSNGIG